MPIKVKYRGYDLTFDSLPTPEAIQRAYETLQSQIRDKMTNQQYQSIERIARTGPLPVSYAQEWLWLLDQFAPGSAAYNLPAAVHLAGPLNIKAFHESLNEIIRRHEILRTAFNEVDGHPVQVISPAEPLELPIIDVSVIPLPDRTRLVEELIASEVSRPFDLSRAPLVRGSLLRIGAEEHVALITIHHIAFDAWSGGVLVKELSALYSAFTKNEPSPLPEPPIQYVDYAAWQRNFLQGAELEAQLAHWKSQLAGAPPLLNLPTDRPRPAVPTYAGTREPFSLSPDLSLQIKELARKEDVTLFMLLLAAYQTLLGRYSKQDDVSVGMSIAGRNRVELEGLIGCFINTLVLRTRLNPNLRFRELLQQVRQTTMKAYEHQELPFEKLIEVLRPERNPTYMPLYQVLLDVINTPNDRVDIPNLTLSPMTSDTRTAKLDLVMDVWESDNGLGGIVEYKTDLFDRETIVKLLGHFETLLTSIVANPEARLSTLEMLTEKEQEQLRGEQTQLAESQRHRFMNVKPKAIELNEGQ